MFKILWNPISKDIKGRYLSDELESEISKWKKENYVVISTPPGSGKSTFVRDVLLKYASENQELVLILSNRIALGLQQKKMLFDTQNLYSIPAKELEHQHTFGNALVYSYQQIMSFLQNPHMDDLISKIGYVVMDEAHFFMSDALFNPQTSTILKNIVHRFSDKAVRVYMSATPKEVMYPIERYESKYFCPKTRFENFPVQNTIERTFDSYYYIGKFDYKDYSIKFFNQWKAIANQIAHSPKEEKWLIFVSEKAMGTEIKTLLKGIMPNNRIELLDAAEKNSSLYTYIVNYERFEADVLISTSVIDNGVNFKDDCLKHIVVDSIDPISIIQMIGRKRRKGNETVNVYLRIPNKEEVDNYFKHTVEMLSYANQYMRDPYGYLTNYWGKLPLAFQQMFSVIPNYNPYPTISLDINELAYLKLEFEHDLLCRLKELLDKEVPNGYEKEALTWIGLASDDFSQDMYLAYTKEIEIQNLCTWLEERVNKIIYKETIEVVAKQFFEFFRAIEAVNARYSKDFKKKIQDCLKQLNLPYGFKKYPVNKNIPELAVEQWEFYRLGDSTRSQSLEQSTDSLDDGESVDVDTDDGSRDSTKTKKQTKSKKKEGSQKPKKNPDIKDIKLTNGKTKSKGNKNTTETNS